MNCLLLRSPFARYDWIYAFLPIKKEYDKHCHTVHKFAEEIIEQRRKELAMTGRSVASKKYLDFIDVLLAAKVQLL